MDELETDGALRAEVVPVTVKGLGAVGPLPILGRVLTDVDPLMKLREVAGRVRLGVVEWLMIAYHSM